MIVTYNDLKNIHKEDLLESIYQIKEECLKKNEHFIFVTSKKHYIPFVSRRVLEFCDKCIVDDFEEGQFSNFQIVKDRYPDRKIDDELLVHFGLAPRSL